MASQKEIRERMARAEEMFAQGYTQIAVCEALGLHSVSCLRGYWLDRGLPVPKRQIPKRKRVRAYKSKKNKGWVVVHNRLHGIIMHEADEKWINKQVELFKNASERYAQAFAHLDIDGINKARNDKHTAVLLVYEFLQTHLSTAEWYSVGGDDFVCKIFGTDIRDSLQAMKESKTNNK